MGRVGRVACGGCVALGVWRWVCGVEMLVVAVCGVADMRCGWCVLRVGLRLVCWTSPCVLDPEKRVCWNCSVVVPVT